MLHQILAESRILHEVAKKLDNLFYGQFRGKQYPNTKYQHLEIAISIEMFYLNTIEQLFLFVEQLDQLEVCLPYSRLLTGIQMLAVFQNLRWNSNKTSLIIFTPLINPLLIHIFLK